jgi:hypothetical protein
MMDDLTAELQLSGTEPPHDAVKQELAARFAGIEEVEQKKIRRKVAREIGEFMREKERPMADRIDYWLRRRLLRAYCERPTRTGPP